MYDNADDDTHWSDSDDSYKRVCNKNWAGQIINIYEDRRLDWMGMPSQRRNLTPTRWMSGTSNNKCNKGQSLTLRALYREITIGVKPQIITSMYHFYVKPGHIPSLASL